MISEKIIPPFFFQKVDHLTNVLGVRKICYQEAVFGVHHKAVPEPQAGHRAPGTSGSKRPLAFNKKRFPIAQVSFIVLFGRPQFIQRFP